MGYGPADYAGKPIIGILNTWSDLNPCHVHFKHRVEDVKRGRAGGRRVSGGDAGDHALARPS